MKCRKCGSKDINWELDCMLTMNPMQYRGICNECGEDLMEQCDRVDWPDYPASRLFGIDHGVSQVLRDLCYFAEDLILNDESEEDKHTVMKVSEMFLEMVDLLAKTGVGKRIDWSKARSPNEAMGKTVHSPEALKRLRIKE